MIPRGAAQNGLAFQASQVSEVRSPHIDRLVRERDRSYTKVGRVPPSDNLREPVGGQAPLDHGEITRESQWSPTFSTGMSGTAVADARGIRRTCPGAGSSRS